MADGAAAVLIASRDYAEKHGLKPRSRIVATADVGEDPTLMLNAPVPAARKVLKSAGLTVDDIDLWEINEAFAVVAEKFMRDLDLDRSKVNVNGGSIALGHPIGATGAIFIGTIVDELERTGDRYGLVTMCAAGAWRPRSSSSVSTPEFQRTGASNGTEREYRRSRHRRRFRIGRGDGACARRKRREGGDLQSPSRQGRSRCG
ncbi:hypothetical protein [Sphingomonas sp. 67-36]|uniref:hypothetical protein n=1 Tax=Sphingomonas sp. 67-36 TaxID=1895849 RepID=UPI0025CE7E27|nr:hypothetical protein [Sphingomonas sp. 67-36]